jgi:hypothetical protein
MPKTEADFPLNVAKVSELLKLAHTYHEQANSCRKVAARLASCIMLGAIVETILIAVTNLFCEEARETPVAIREKIEGRKLASMGLGSALGRRVAQIHRKILQLMKLHIW